MHSSKIKWLILILFLAIPLFFIAKQNTKQEIVIKIREAINKADAKAFADKFANNIEITIKRKRKIYSRTQAEFVIKDFFKHYYPKKFDYIIQKPYKKGKRYAIGEYAYSAGTFQFFIIIQKIEGIEKITKLDIQED